MSQSRKYVVPTVEYARAALREGPMQRVSGYYVARYRDHKRAFQIATINRLIAAGEAVKCGAGVVSVEHLRGVTEAAE